MHKKSPNPKMSLTDWVIYFKKGNDISSSYLFLFSFSISRAKFLSLWSSL